MSLVTVKNKYQVVIPRSVREQLGIGVGDLLEAKAENGRITLIPKTVMDRSVAEALAALRGDAKKKGTARLTRREINGEIAAVRGKTQSRTNARKQSGK